MIDPIKGGLQWSPFYPHITTLRTVNYKVTSTPTRIPDAVNLTKTSKFTQVPNDLLRETKISFKAKGILCLLLSNREGWYSYVSTIAQMGREGEDAIRSGLQELEEYGYLVRLRYRCKETKKFRGILWGYTDTPGQLNIQKALEMLDEMGLELQTPSSNPHPGNPHVGFPHVENPGLIIPILKTPIKQEEEEEEKQATRKRKRTRWNHDNQKITPSMFDEFWAMYPRKVDKGKAKTKWNQICNKPATDDDRPTWGTIKESIQAQSKSERWQDKKFIPHPTTWLNQQRWLDDPEEMTSGAATWNDSAPVHRTTNKTTASVHRTTNKNTAPIEDGPGPRPLFRKEFGNDLGDWMFENCFRPTRNLLAGPDGELRNNVTRSMIAQRLVSLHRQIQERQKHLSPDFFETFPAYGPLSLIRAYIDYLTVAKTTWLDTPTLNMLDVEHTIFNRFRREYARETDHFARDPFTGSPSTVV